MYIYICIYICVCVCFCSVFMSATDDLRTLAATLGKYQQQQQNYFISKSRYEQICNNPSINH